MAAAIRETNACTLFLFWAFNTEINLFFYLKIISYLTWNTGGSVQKTNQLMLHNETKMMVVIITMWGEFGLLMLILVLEMVTTQL